MMPRLAGAANAPDELKLKNPASAPVSRAKIFRTVSMIPRYVAGVDRAETPIEDWSTTTASGWAAISSATSVLLPDPATPVTAGQPRSGRPPSRPAGCGGRRPSPTRGRRPRVLAPRAVRRPNSAPVSVSRRPARPASPRTPPGRRPAPAPGPMSTTWSASAMTSGSCSTTSTVLPLSRMAAGVAEEGGRRRAGAARRWARRDVRHPGRAGAECRTVFSRCPSPPDRVAVSQSRRPRRKAEADRLDALQRGDGGTGDGPGPPEIVDPPRSTAIGSVTYMAEQSADGVPARSGCRAPPRSARRRRTRDGRPRPGTAAPAPGSSRSSPTGPAEIQPLEAVGGSPRTRWSRCRFRCR